MSAAPLVPADSDALIVQVRAVFERSIRLKRDVAEQHAATIVAIALEIVASIEQGGKLLLCGNGGSAADAQHMAAEMLVRLRPTLDRAAIPALSLAIDMSSMTACANDYEYDAYFERMTRALGRPGDVLMGITTSGRSASVIRALRAARESGLRTIGLLGGSGQPALAECDVALVVPSDETGRVQEAHITIGHAVMELVEDSLSKRRAT
jgi:D-sedoheptulose 7-phosphate isomerase